nr:MAG TPA: cysteine-rich protein [Caudoviricetes sp.]
MSETPKCPYCGDRMHIHVSLITPEWELLSAQYRCVTCGSTSPRIEFPGDTANDEIIERLQAVSSRRAEPKNRVLTMEELKAYCEGGADAAPLWYESKDYSDVNRWMVIDLPKHAFGGAATVNCFVNGHFFKPTYGEEWRCWLRNPTEAERRETPWAGDNHE